MGLEVCLGFSKSAGMEDRHRAGESDMWFGVQGKSLDTSMNQGRAMT